MLLKSDANFIIMERGVDDLGVLRELEGILYTKYNGDRREFATKNPMLSDIMQRLFNEIRMEEG